MGILTVLWEKWVEFRRDFFKITAAALITPVMYLIIFGLGIQTTSHGEPYLHFLVPGVVAMSTMTGSFSAIAQNMSVQRLYEKALDQVMVSPTPLWQFILGQVIGGSLRGMYSGCMILLLTLPISTDLTFNGLSFLCNTFFSTDQMPVGFRQVISFLPLSQSCDMIRKIANGESSGYLGFIILAAYLAIFGFISVMFIYKKKNL